MERGEAAVNKMIQLVKEKVEVKTTIKIRAKTTIKIGVKTTLETRAKTTIQIEAKMEMKVKTSIVPVNIRKVTQLKQKKTVVEIDCSGPDITVQSVQQQHSKSRHTDRHTSTRTSSTTDPNNSFKAVERASSWKGLKRRGAKRSHKSWKEARARFKSSEDLIHRLYVCISGAA